jgi:hypothetical protein
MTGRLPVDHPDAPGYWMYESSGVLGPVVRAYLLGDELDAVQMKLMKAYLSQWVNSPVWDQNPHPDTGLEELRSLRVRVAAINNEAELNQAIQVMTDMGMDPL